MTILVKRIDMALHIQELCAVNHITVSYQRLDAEVPNYYADVTKKHIHIRPTKNTGYYVSALHEIGHILGDNQTYNNTVKEREIGAWIWAMLNAKVWTDTARS
jgi:elongation factor P hydroxylase